MFGNILDCQDPGDLVTWVEWVDCRIAAKFLVFNSLCRKDLMQVKTVAVENQVPEL